MLKDFEVVGNTVIIKEGVTCIDFNFWGRNKPGDIKKIVFPSTLKEIGVHAFSDFLNIESVEIPESVETVGDYAFARCRKLKEVKVGKNVTKIGDAAFENCDLTKIELPDGVKSIGEHAFQGNHDLQRFVVPKEVVSLGRGCFYGCVNLEEVVINNKLQEIGGGCFYNCKKIKSFYFPDNFKRFNGLNYSAFYGCDNLERISMPITTFIADRDFKKQVLGVEVVGRMNGQEIVLQKGKDENFVSKTEFLKTIGKNNIGSDEQMIENQYLGDDIKLWDISMKSDVIEFKNGNIFVNGENKSTFTTKNELFKKATKANELDTLGCKSYYKIIPWLDYKFIPGKVVVRRLPEKEVPLFYVNNNANNWATLVRSIQNESDVEKSTLFKLAYALGVFSPDAKESKIATEFIKEEILDKMTPVEMHELFDRIPNGVEYDSDAGKFFMIHYKENPRFFMVVNEFEGVEPINYIGHLFLRFKDVRKAYPYKKIVSRQDNERLTVGQVMGCVARHSDLVGDERASKLRDALGFYGYTQEEYNVVESWFLKGLELDKDSITLKAQPDKMLEEIKNSQRAGDASRDNRVTYELLGKDEAGLAYGAIAGIVTNCCQVYGSAGASCEEYGMTQPNSSFVLFRDSSGKIIGQAWTWYDATTKQITLDNIEVPAQVIETINKNSDLQSEFLNALQRLKAGFIAEMGAENVSNVTIGAGYNDINNLLGENYEIIKNPQTLTGYNGYSDANRTQYIIPNMEQTKIVEPEVVEVEEPEIVDKEQSIIAPISQTNDGITL